MTTLRDYINGLRREWSRAPSEQMPDAWHRAICSAYCEWEGHRHVDNGVPTCEYGLAFAAAVRWPR